MDWLASFRQDLQLRNMTTNTIYRIMGNTQRYLVWAQERGLDPSSGGREDILAYLADLRARGFKATSINAIFISLNSYYEYLVEAGQLTVNPIPAIRKKYLHAYKDEIRQLQLISVENAAKMVRATIDSRDRAILLVFLKTGIRRNELISLDLEDLDLESQRLTLKPTAKRSNRIVFFDDEARRALSRWLKSRETRYQRGDQKALFLNAKGTRMQSTGIDGLVKEAAIRVGLHDPTTPRLDDKFTPHTARHWWTTQLLRSGMRREYVQWLRGDAIREAVDIYYHIDPEDVRRAYLACIPQLGI